MVESAKHIVRRGSQGSSQSLVSDYGFGDNADAPATLHRIEGDFFIGGSISLNYKVLDINLGLGLHRLLNIKAGLPGTGSSHILTSGITGGKDEL